MSMNSSPKISIVTPCYNSEKFIHRLHDSLCRQDYKNFEWILVDDCSTDNTVEVLKNLISSGDGGILLYALPQNSGGGVATGFGVEKSRGEIVILIDHDDELFESALSMAVAEWEGIATRPNLAGLFYRRFDPVAGKVIGEELVPGTEFSMSWLSNTKPSIIDGVYVLKRVVARKYFNAQALEAICLAGVPLNLMTKRYKIIAGKSSPLVIYHRDNMDSQTLWVRISRKTIYTYAKYIDAYDIYYLRRLTFWIRHIVALIKFSMIVYGNPIYHHRYIGSKLIVSLSYILLPLGIVSYFFSKKNRVIDFPLYDLARLRQLKRVNGV
jgi:glycosyltransferase involved in cell wall biosynthesis